MDLERFRKISNDEKLTHDDLEKIRHRLRPLAVYYAEEFIRKSLQKNA